VQIGLDSCPLYPTISCLYFYGSLYVLLNFNTGMADNMSRLNILDMRLRTNTDKGHL
jgi:hypothetical protein